MFKSEISMVKPVVKWMESMDLTVKSEFITPWGICDLVGLSFNQRNVRHRLRLGQTEPIGSVTRAALLLKIPDIETNESITLRRLVRDCAPTISEDSVREHTNRLIEAGFVSCPSGDRLQRLNGWMPLHKRLIAVELKLSRVEEAMRQARNNLTFADQSYVGLPKDLAVRVAQGRNRWSSFLDAGVGVLAVAPRACAIVKPSRRRSSEPAPDPILRFYCAEKFWRTSAKDNKA
jgi:hypothetical protein